jgi:serine/threonine protein kinase
VALAAGARLGPYEIVSALGAGGMGEVYRAKDPRLGRDVAMKILPAAFSADPDRLRRFEQEARSAAALNHPNILTVHEIGTHAGQPYIVSELLEGQTLRDALGHGALPVKKAIEYAIQICHGLAAAHEKGIVHRDLKPENVFVTKDGRIKILDFGLAKLTDVAVLGAGATMMATRAETSPGSVIGTISYMSPEQVRGQAVDHPATSSVLGRFSMKRWPASARSPATPRPIPSAPFWERIRRNSQSDEAASPQVWSGSFDVAWRNCQGSASSPRPMSHSRWRLRRTPLSGQHQPLRQPTGACDGPPRSSSRRRLSSPH